MNIGSPIDSEDIDGSSTEDKTKMKGKRNAAEYFDHILCKD
jgi:hypothetical protein